MSNSQPNLPTNIKVLVESPHLCVIRNGVKVENLCVFTGFDKLNKPVRYVYQSLPNGTLSNIPVDLVAGDLIQKCDATVNAVLDLEALQEAFENALENVVIEVSQSGDWVVTVDGVVEVSGTVDIGNPEALAEAIAEALAGLEVTLNDDQLQALLDAINAIEFVDLDDTANDLVPQLVACPDSCVFDADGNVKEGFKVEKLVFFGRESQTVVSSTFVVTDLSGDGSAFDYAAAGCTVGPCPQDETTSGFELCPIELDGVLTGFIAFTPNNDGTLAQSYLDANFEPTATKPEGTKGPTFSTSKANWTKLCNEDNVIAWQIDCLPLNSAGIPQIGDAKTLWLLADGTYTDVAPEGFTPCVNEPCWHSTGKIKCLGSDDSNNGTSATYTNTDNTTELSTSSNSTTLKWSLGTGAPASDEAEAQAFTQAIVDCINSGEIAHITYEEANTGFVREFDAVSILADGSATGGWAFSGTAISGGTGADKMRNAQLVCGDAGSVELSGEACQQYSCELNEYRWVIFKDGVVNVLTLEQEATLTECPPYVECLTTTVSILSCAIEEVDGVEVGDKLLTVNTVDCNNVVQSNTTYNIDNNNAEVTEAVLTESCTDADVEELKQCIRDTNGVEWTWLSIVDTDGNILSQLFINSETLALGTPAGEPKEWQSCVIASSPPVVVEKCFYSSDGTRYEGCELRKFDADGFYLESTYLINGEEYTILPDGLRGAFDCDLCIQYAGCFDPRIERFTEITMGDGVVHTFSPAANSNEVQAWVTSNYGGSSSIPTEYSNPPSISCSGTNLHEFQFIGTNTAVVEIVGNQDTYTFNAVGGCEFINPQCELERECVLLDGEVYDAFVTRNVKTKEVICAETITGIEIPKDEVFVVTENFTADTGDIIKVNSTTKEITVVGSLQAESVQLLDKSDLVLQTATVSKATTSELTGTETLQLATKEAISFKAVKARAETKSKEESKG